MPPLGDRRRRRRLPARATGWATIASGYVQVARLPAPTTWPIVLGFCFGVIGWLAGIGVLNYPRLKLLGIEPAPAVPDARASRASSE